MQNKPKPLARYYGTQAFNYDLDAFSLSHVQATVPEHEVHEHSHAQAHVIFTTRGRYLSSAQGEVREGPVVIFNPAGVVHRDRFADQLGWFLALSLDSSSLVNEKQSLRLPDSAIRTHSAATLASAFNLLKIAQSADKTRLDIECASLALLQNFDTQTTTLSKQLPGWLKQAQELIADMSEHDLSIAQIADVVGVHRVYLARQYQRHLGLSPGADLRLRRIQRAMHLLMTSQNSLCEIATTCGYCDQSHLNRALWQHLRLSPGEFRLLGIAGRGCKNPRPDSLR